MRSLSHVCHRRLGISIAARFGGELACDGWTTITSSLARCRPHGDRPRARAHGSATGHRSICVAHGRIRGSHGGSGANTGQQRANVLVQDPLAVQHQNCAPRPSQTLSTTSVSYARTMQAAVHPLPPQMLPQYHRRQSLNAPIPTMDPPTVMPTPPIAARKRKRAHQFTVNYSEVQEVDGDGRLREVIVIEDTPPPPTASPATTHNGAFSASYQPPMYSAPIRTRARAAAEAQGLSSSASTFAAPAPKKRKRDPIEEVRAPPSKKLISSVVHAQAFVPSSKLWDTKTNLITAEVRLTYASSCPQFR